MKRDISEIKTRLPLRYGNRPTLTPCHFQFSSSKDLSWGVPDVRAINWKIHENPMFDEKSHGYIISSVPSKFSTMINEPGQMRSGIRWWNYQSLALCCPQVQEWLHARQPRNALKKLQPSSSGTLRVIILISMCLPISSYFQISPMCIELPSGCLFF